MRRIIWFFLVGSLVLQAQVGQRQLLTALFTPASSATPTWIQGAGSGNCTSSATCAVTLTSNPTNGHLVICGGTQNLTNTALSTVKDANNVSYTVSVNSPSPQQSTGSAGEVWIAYLLSASGANKVITFTWASAGGTENVWCDEFAPPSGKTAAFDTDVGNIASAWTVPSITPGIATNVLYATATVTGSITAPAGGATIGSSPVWTGAGGGISADGNMAEYTINAPAVATTANFSPAQSHSTMIASIKFQ